MKFKTSELIKDNYSKRFIPITLNVSKSEFDKLFEKGQRWDDVVNNVELQKFAKIWLNVFENPKKYKEMKAIMKKFDIKYNSRSIFTGAFDSNVTGGAGGMCDSFLCSREAVQGETFCSICGIFRVTLLIICHLGNTTGNDSNYVLEDMPKIEPFAFVTGALILYGGSRIHAHLNRPGGFLDFLRRQREIMLIHADDTVQEIVLDRESNRIVNFFPLIDADDDVNICRICFCEFEHGQRALFPCLCNGSQKFIHESCYERLRQHRFNKCPTCKSEFQESNIATFQ